MASKKPSPRQRTMRMLLVDDNKDVVSMLAALLRRVGHEIFVAHDGPSALATASECRPDAILLDIGLPGMDGYELAREMLKRPELENACFVAMTGYGREEDILRAQEAGFHFHLLKPVRLEDIEKVLDRCDALTKSDCS